MTITRQTIYQFTNSEDGEAYEKAKRLAKEKGERGEIVHLSSPSAGVYQCVQCVVTAEMKEEVL